MADDKMIKVYKLNNYPILHRFLAELYKRCDIYTTDDMLEFIKDDDVMNYILTADDSMSIYLRSDRLPILEEDAEYVETYDSDKGLLVLHFYTNGNIEIEALEYKNYPFKEEMIQIYNSKEVGFALESDLEEELQQERLDDIQRIVNEYFNVERNTLETIIVE